MLINTRCICAITIMFFYGCKQKQKNEQKVKEETKPNVVLFVVDDLGWTDAHVYGSDLYQTPNIDQMAKDGVLFTNAYAATNVCSPTRASLITGKYPARLHITDWITGHERKFGKIKIPDWQKAIQEEEYTIGELFQDNNYKTFHVGKWHLGESEKDWPEYHGFDINIAGNNVGSPKAHGGGGYFSPYNNKKLEDGPEGEYLTERLANEVINIISENKNEPFFLNFWLYNVHTPLQAAQSKIDKYDALVKPNMLHNNSTYAAMVEHMDDALGKVLAALKENGLEDNTIVVFTSDNGGLRGNHENGKVKVTDNTPLRSGKGDIYEGGVRIPLIFKWPNHIKRGQVVNEISISPDLYPTLMVMANLKFPENTTQDFDGIDLSGVINGEETESRKAIFWHYPHYHLEGSTPHSAVRYEDWKLIRLYEDDSYQLYNLANDLGETKDLSVNNLKKLEELKLLLNNWLIETNAQLPIPNDDYDLHREGEWSISKSATK